MPSLLKVTYRKVPTKTDNEPQPGDKPGFSTSELIIEGFGPETIMGAVRDLMHPSHRSADGATIGKIEIVPDWDGKDSVWGVWGPCR